MASKYIHVRVKSPKGAKTCRTQSIGSKGTKRIACKYPKTGWTTQAFLLPKNKCHIANKKPVCGTKSTIVATITKIYGKITPKKGGFTTL